ncbi:MAG: YitT family protein [Eubacterium sp.]
MKNDKVKDTLKFIFRYICITFGSLLYAVAVSLFLDPNNLAPGGVSGIAIVVKEFFPILPGIGMLILIFNIPIMIIGIRKFGFKFILSTIYTLIVSSIMIDILPAILRIRAVTTEPMLAAVIGGALFGASMGIMFRLETTTGGMDIIVKLIRQKKPHLKTGQIFIILDIAVLIGAALAFQNIEVALYAGIAIAVASVIMDKTLYGADQATLVYIISDRRKIIAVRMLKELNLGVTMVQGIGAYNNEKTEVILCVMRKQNLIKVRNLLKETDPNAFMIVSSANEVFGEGFKDPYKVEI